MGRKLKVHMVDEKTRRYETDWTWCGYATYLLEGRVTMDKKKVTCRHCLKQIEIEKRK